MKHFFAIVSALLFGALQMNAQSIGYINTEKILAEIPAYVNAQAQLESLSKKYQQEIESGYAKIEAVYNNSSSCAIILIGKDTFEFENFPSLQHEKIRRFESLDALTAHIETLL